MKDCKIAHDALSRMYKDGCTHVSTQSNKLDGIFFCGIILQLGILQEMFLSMKLCVPSFS